MSLNFALFDNNNKSKDTHPDFTGPVSVDSDFVDFISNLVNLIDRVGSDKIILKVAGWKRESKNGTQYVSCSINVDEYRMNKESEIPF